MLKNLIVKRGALVLLLVGMVAGAAGAQIAQNLYRSRYITTGLFTLEKGGQARFHVSLDDRNAATNAQVLMRIYDGTGQIVARKIVTLAPGQSATLAYSHDEGEGEGTFRGQAEVFESALTLSDRRIVLASMETFDPVPNGGPEDLLYRGTVCGPGANIPAGSD